MECTVQNTSLRNYASFYLQVPSILSILLDDDSHCVHYCTGNAAVTVHQSANVLLNRVSDLWSFVFSE
jgi:hypothetical protein